MTSLVLENGRQCMSYSANFSMTLQTDFLIVFFNRNFKFSQIYFLKFISLLEDIDAKHFDVMCLFGSKICRNAKVLSFYKIL